MSNIKIEADLGPAIATTSAVKELNRTLNEKQHLSVVTQSAFDIMEGAFVWDTAAISEMQPESFHHIYEPEHIGEPPFQLFKVRMTGRGGNRTITWDWRASKLTVPTDVGPTGRYRWAGAGDKFDPSKLNRVHVFVWKAPVMEYGTTVTVRPKLSALLVFPASEVHGSKMGAVFTPHSYTFTPGRLVQGNFTSWFLRWWDEGMAEQSLSKWKKKRDYDFRRSFEQRISSANKASSPSGRGFGVSEPARRRGETIAELVANDMSRHYIETARRRRKVTGPSEE